MFTWHREVLVAAFFGVSLFTSIEAHATHWKVISGLMGAQDEDSKKMLSMSPDEANRAATRDLLSVLKPTGKFTPDIGGNVEKMTFLTTPYQTTYRYVCRQDSVTLWYNLEDKHNAAGVWTGFGRKPEGVDAEQTYHIEQLPVPGFIPGSSYPATACDASHPEITANWFVAPSTIDAVRAANMFRMAEDEAKAGRLKPSLCDAHGSDTCQHWLISLDDPSKITEVKRCETKTDDDACYVISLDAVDITIAGTIPKTEIEPVTPTAITSVGVDDVITVSE